MGKSRLRPAFLGRGEGKGLVWARGSKGFVGVGGAERRTLHEGASSHLRSRNFSFQFSWHTGVEGGRYLGTEAVWRDVHDVLQEEVVEEVPLSWSRSALRQR